MRLSIATVIVNLATVSAFTAKSPATPHIVPSSYHPHRHETHMRVSNEGKIDEVALGEKEYEDGRSTEMGGGVAEVVLVGCGAPNRGMGWYHAIQMLEGR